MSKSAQLRIADVRALYELAGECRDLGDDPGTWRRHCFTRLAQLAGADLVVGGEMTRRGGEVTPVGTVGCGWENGFDPSVLAGALAGPFRNLLASPHIAAYFVRSAPGDGPGLTRPELVSNHDWLGSAYFRCVHEPFGLGHVMISFRTIHGTAGEFIGVTLGRVARERRDFSVREKELIREAHALLAPLVGGPLARFTEPLPSDLSPRQREVLRCLLEGDGDKQVAARLGISRFTVNVHTKVIFRHFNVQSRAELLARWVRRGWGARCAWADDGQ